MYIRMYVWREGGREGGSTDTIGHAQGIGNSHSNTLRVSLWNVSGFLCHRYID